MEERRGREGKRGRESFLRGRLDDKGRESKSIDTRKRVEKHFNLKNTAPPKEYLLPL
jgi:hypothetical protein